MTRIANSKGRAYGSPLRAQQAEETRVRILDATVRVMARGLATLSIPAVAREAGVSVPTVYRHFGTKLDLLEAVYPHLASRAGLTGLLAPGTVDEFREMVRSMFDGLDSLGEEARAAFASPAVEESRRLSMPRRIAMSRRFVHAVAPGATQADRDRMARLLMVLSTTAAMRMWCDYLGSSVGEAADDVDWLIRAMIAAVTRRKGK